MTAVIIQCDSQGVWVIIFKSLIYLWDGFSKHERRVLLKYILAVNFRTALGYFGAAFS